MLTQVKNEFGTGVISQYDYISDALGRRESMTTSGPAFDSVEPNPLAEITETYTTNELNQYTQISTVERGYAPAYDLDGNLTDDNTFQYDYDAENRLIAVTPLFPLRHPYKLEFEYDYKSRRVGKQVYEWLQADNWLLDSATTFVYDGWNLIKESITVNGETSRNSYVWGLDLSGTLQGAGGIGGLLMRNTDSGDYLYLYDANGNVGQLVDAADGNIAARYEYDPFGNLLAATGPEAEKNPFRFSTKYFDAETGLYYYGYRYYSPGLGRWINRDPIGEQGGLNLYAYVWNNPIQLLDPLGLTAGECVTGLNECVARKAKEYVGSTDIGDCADVAFTALIECAAELNVPLSLPYREAGKWKYYR